MMVQGAKGDLKYFEKRKRIKDFVAIFKDGKLIKVKTYPTGNPEHGYGVYILPRKIEEDFSDTDFDQCNNCQFYFPDGLDSCEHCDEKFCCDCADEHRDEITDEYRTGGCRF